MRTLKKTLSLVLVVAMVLGLCVVGASATNKVDGYEDAGKIGAAYTEAVGVMTGLGIVDGVTDTELRPENTYQRDQAAKIIAYMLLGQKKADSLSCTVAPFEDVPANHWAAGYIAFCKEQGIIDGVTETTFNPTGTLTGFQWAKMLLCAVGFGVNGEFEGDTWSLNTSKVAHTVDLFAGDLAGADHVALQRQQAMLYAFNVLTGVGCVVWSESLGDYIYSYDSTIFDRFTYQGTLGWNVWKLTSVTGIIYDNEGMGADVTTVSAGYSGSSQRLAQVAADTGLDMYKHAAKIWYTGTKYVDNATGADIVGKGTAVYVMDLAKTTNATCMSIDATKAAATKGKSVSSFTVGDGYKAYEYSFIDNTAINAGYADVTFYYTQGQLGVRSEKNSTTVIAGYGAIANSDIMTDISKISNRQNVIILRAESQVNNNNQAYYVYALGAASGVVTKVSNTAKTITLDDGTVLEPSVFSNIDLNSIKVGIAYSFVLDSHGHYIGLAENVGIAYFTGTVRDTAAHEAWYGEAAYVAQFIDVTTGTITEVPVTTAWAKTIAKTGSYYDITNVLYGTNKYYPALVETVGAATSREYGVYVINDGPVNFTANTWKVTGSAGTVYVDMDTVTFVIASGKGTNASAPSYKGFAELLKAYNVLGNENTVTLENIAMTTTKISGDTVATVIFAYDGIKSTTGGYLFIPTNIAASAWTNHAVVGGAHVYTYDGFYLNGKEVKETITVSTQQPFTRGFYYYTVTDGLFSLGAVAPDTYVYHYNDVHVTPNYVLEILGTNKYWNISDWQVIDLRKDIADKDAIDSPSDLVLNDYTEADRAKVDLAFVPADKVLYVVDAGTLNTVTVVENLADWRIVSGGVASDVATTGDVIVNTTVKYTGSHTYAEDDTVHFTVKGTDYAVEANADGTFTIPVKVTNVGEWKDVKVEITAAYVVVTVDVADTAAAGYTYAPAEYYDAQTKQVNIGEVIGNVVLERNDGQTGAAGTLTALINDNVVKTVPYDTSYDLTISFTSAVYADTTYTVNGLK